MNTFYNSLQGGTRHLIHHFKWWFIDSAACRHYSTALYPSWLPGSWGGRWCRRCLGSRCISSQWWGWVQTSTRPRGRRWCTPWSPRTGRGCCQTPRSGINMNNQSGLVSGQWVWNARDSVWIYHWFHLYHYKSLTLNKASAYLYILALKHMIVIGWSTSNLLTAGANQVTHTIIVHVHWTSCGQYRYGAKTMNVCFIYLICRMQ